LRPHTRGAAVSEDQTASDRDISMTFSPRAGFDALKCHACPVVPDSRLRRYSCHQASIRTRINC